MNNLNKKAQGLSLNTIIIAIVVLIVLVVLIMIFTGYFGSRFTPEVTSCANAGDSCEDKDSGCGFDAFGGSLRPISGSCLKDRKPDPDKICCPRGLGTGKASDNNDNTGNTGSAGNAGNNDASASRSSASAGNNGAAMDTCDPPVEGYGGPGELCCWTTDGGTNNYYCHGNVECETTGLGSPTCKAS